MAKKRLLACISLAAMAATAQAQQPVDLMQVYELALKNDAQLAAAQASLKASQEVVPQSRARLLPQIGISGTTSDNRNKILGDRERIKNWNTHGWQANLTQPLFNLESWFNFQRAGLLSEQASLRFALEQQNLIMRVSEAYFDVLRAEDNLSSAEAEEKAVKRQLEQTSQRFEVGLIAETDVHEARAAYDGSRVTRILAENKVAVSLENLRTLTNTVAGDLAKLNKGMPVSSPAPAVAEKWVQTSLSQNLQLEANRKAVEAADVQLKASRSGHAPTVNFVASFGHNVNNGQHSSVAKNESSVFRLQATLPLFSGGATSSKVRESGYRLSEIQKQQDHALRDVSAKTRNLFNTVNADVARVDARCQGIVSASSALKATESGYEVGTRNIVDVLNAQRNLYGAQRDYLNARYDFIINTLQLKQMAGTLSPQDLKDLNVWMTNKKDTDLTPDCGGAEKS